MHANCISVGFELSTWPDFKQFRMNSFRMLAAVKPQSLSSSVPHLLSDPDDRLLETQLTELLNEVGVRLVESARRIAVFRWNHADCQQFLDSLEKPPSSLHILALGSWLDRAANRGLLRRTDFRAIAMLLLSSLHGPAMLTDLRGRHPTGYSPSEYFGLLVEIILEGLRVQPRNGVNH